MSEESSLLSLDEFSESYKEKKLDNIKNTLMSLLNKGESPCKALERLRLLLKNNINKSSTNPNSKKSRKFTIDKNNSPKSAKKESFSFKLNKSDLKKSKFQKNLEKISFDNNFLKKRVDFNDIFNVRSETSSISSINANSVFDFEKKELPPHLKELNDSLMDTQ